VPACHGRLVAVAAVLLACGWARAEDLPVPDEAKPLDEKAARRVIEDAISQAANPAAASPTARPAPTSAAAADSLLVARISAEVAAKQLEAKRLSQKSPADALDLLDITAKGLDEADRMAQVRAHPDFGNGHRDPFEIRVGDLELAHDLDQGVAGQFAGAKLALGRTGAGAPPGGGMTFHLKAPADLERGSDASLRKAGLLCVGGVCV
jgi:hypothetical protein